MGKFPFKTLFFLGTLGYILPMVEILEDAQKWMETKETAVVIAVLIEIEGSAVRGKGAVMAVNSDGLMTGSISGGCIESTVLNVSERVFKTRRPEIIKFCQIDDEILGSVSPCGGELTVAVGILDPEILNSFSILLESGRGGRWGLVSSGPRKTDAGAMFVMDSNGLLMPGSFRELEADFPEETVKIGNKVRESEKTGIRSLGGYQVFSVLLKPSPQLVIVGASHIGTALAKTAKVTGYRVTVVDPRAVFARVDRFESSVHLLNAWPRKAFKTINFTPYTAIAVITHDTKIDDQALRLAFETNNFYIGALGSSSTHKERVERLVAQGLSESDCGKIHSPIGIRIDSANPEEIAISIMAEIIREYRLKYGKHS